jgi:hypothetical protein
MGDKPVHCSAGAFLNGALPVNAGEAVTPVTASLNNFSINFNKLYKPSQNGF